MSHLKNCYSYGAPTHRYTLVRRSCSSFLSETPFMKRVYFKLVEFELGWKLACFPSSEVLSNPLFTFLARVKSIRYNYHHHSPQGCWAEGRNSIIWTIPSFSFYSRVTEMQIGFYWSCYSSPPSMMRPICHWHQNLDNPNFRTIFTHYVFFIVFPSSQ